MFEHYKKTTLKKKQIKKNRVELDEPGENCPRCGHISVVREHISLESQLKRKKYCYSKWFLCMNTNCKVTIFYDEKYRVYPDKKKNRIKVSSRDSILDDGRNTTKGSNLNWNKGSNSSTPPWLTDKEYETESRLQAIKRQLKPR